MKLTYGLRVAAFAMCFFAFSTLGTLAQQTSLTDQLAGVWTLVFADNVSPDGTRRQVFGPNPKGIMILDGSGRYSEMIVNSNRPKFTSNSRLQGTPEENRAVVTGTIAAFGTWSVNEADKTLAMQIEGSLFPNRDGVEGKRLIISVTPQSLKIANPGAGAGGRAEGRIQARKMIVWSHKDQFVCYDRCPASKLVNGWEARMRTAFLAALLLITDAALLPAQQTSGPAAGLQINLPDVVAEVTAAHDRYNNAINARDGAVLLGSFP